METIDWMKGRLEGWAKEFNISHLKDKSETVFVQIVSLNNKTKATGTAVCQINPKGKQPVFEGYDDGMILDKDSTTHIIKVSRPDQKSSDEEIFFITVTAESQYDSGMVANHVTSCLLEFLREIGKLKFAA